MFVAELGFFKMGFHGHYLRRMTSTVAPLLTLSQQAKSLAAELASISQGKTDLADCAWLRLAKASQVLQLSLTNT